MFSCTRSFFFHLTCVQSYLQFVSVARRPLLNFLWQFLGAPSLWDTSRSFGLAHSFFACRVRPQKQLRQPCLKITSPFKNPSEHSTARVCESAGQARGQACGQARADAAACCPGTDAPRLNAFLLFTQLFALALVHPQAPVKAEIH